MAPNNFILLEKKEWGASDGGKFPEFISIRDSFHIVFNNEKYLNYSKNNYINEKSIFDLNTYNIVIKETSKKNEDNREYIFEITEQDYLLADSL